MNKEEILNMPEGKEIDDLVAEKVMGWHKEKQAERYREHWVDSENRYECGVSLESEFPDCEDLHCLIWYPSSSIVWAWEVVEKLCNETGCDVVKVCKRDPELLRGEWSCNFGRGFEAFADTPELAICRAALLTTLGEDD